MSIEYHLSREFLRVVEEAAIAASRTMGQGAAQIFGSGRGRGHAEGDGHAADARAPS